ncbi:MAG: glutamate mutase L, partial [Anaerolineae bacterium]|nr:glutamate mutase L [Anaerolineae bacterium]
TDNGDSKRLLGILDVVALSLGLREVGKRPQVVYAGNRALRERVTAELGSQTTVHVADNLRPTVETEHIGEVANLVNTLYEELKMAELPGFGEVVAWSSYPPQPTARAFSQMVRYFAALYQERVLGLDLGSNSVTIAVADEKNLQVAIHSNRGMGEPIAEFLDAGVVREIQKWLAIDVAEDTLADFLQTKALYPGTMPMTDEELQVEQALARYFLREAAGGAARNWAWPAAGSTVPPFALLLLRGQALTQAPRSAQALLMALDALQPTGVFAVALDQYGVLPALGLLALRHPLPAVQILEGGVLLDLGWVVAPRFRAAQGQTILRVRVNAEKQGQLNVEVAAGDLTLLPLAPGEQAELILEPSRRVDVGFGPGQGKTITIHGGTAGLVIDARGRPIELPKDQEERQALLQRWRWDMGG